jgi:hypothetical protein
MTRLSDFGEEVDVGTLLDADPRPRRTIITAEPSRVSAAIVLLQIF